MEATFSCPQCSFCVDHDVMLRVLKHFFNCTSFQYIMDLSCGHHPGLGHCHITGAPQHKKYKHTSYNSVSSVNKDMGSQDRSVQEEPAIEESMAENELDNSTTMVPSVEVKTEPPDDTESTVFEPAAPPAQLMDTAAFREDCHPVSVVCAMGGIQDTSALAGSSSDPGETETHTITTEPVGAPSMVVTRPSAMAASRAQPGSAHDNRDGGGLELDRLLDSDRPPQTTPGHATTADLPLHLTCTQVSHPTHSTMQEEQVDESPEDAEESSDEEYLNVPPSRSKDVISGTRSFRRKRQLCAHNYPVKWAAKVYQIWAEQENKKMLAEEPGKKLLAPTDWSKTTPEEANVWVSKYLTEVKKQDGTPYTPSTLQTLAQGLDHHIKEELGIHHLGLMSSDPQFAAVQSALANQKQIFSHLEGASKCDVKEFTVEEETQLWREVFDLNTPLGLLYAVYYHTCKLFGVLTGEEHRSLTVSQFIFGCDDNGQFIKFIRHGRKKKDQGKMYMYYASPGSPWCVVNLYRLYLSKIPPGGLFYFRPITLQTSPCDSRCWYGTQPIGHNYFASIMGKLAEMIGLEGRYTAASACKKRPFHGDLPRSKRPCLSEHVPSVCGTTGTQDNQAPVNIAPESPSAHSAGVPYSTGSVSFTGGPTSQNWSGGDPTSQQMYMLVPVARPRAGTGDIAAGQAARGNDREPYQS